MQPETRYAKSGDVHVAYQVFGEGSVDLVLVPGHISTPISNLSRSPRTRGRMPVL